MRRATTCRVSVLAWLLVAALVAIQPLGVLEHVVHDHLDDHDHAAHAAVADAGEGHAPDHDADHEHVWTTPAVVLVKPSIDRPQEFRARVVVDDAPLASAAPRPPFSPPRA